MCERTGNVDSAGTFNGDGRTMLWGPARTVQWKWWWGKELYSSGKPLAFFLWQMPGDFIYCHFGVSSLGDGPIFQRYCVSWQYLDTLRQLELGLRNTGLQNYHLWKSRPLNLIWTSRNQRQGSIYVRECVVAWKLQIKIIHAFMCKSPSLWYTNWEAVWFPCSFCKQAACSCTL